PSSMTRRSDSRRKCCTRAVSSRVACGGAGACERSAVPPVRVRHAAERRRCVAPARRLRPRRARRGARYAIRHPGRAPGAHPVRRYARCGRGVALPGVAAAEAGRVRGGCDGCDAAGRRRRRRYRLLGVRHGAAARARGDAGAAHRVGRVDAGGPGDACMRIDGLLFDLDGTLYTDDAPIPGAAELLHQLHARGIVCRYLTNTTRFSRRGLLERLRAFGFPVEPDELFTAATAAVRWLERQGIERIATYIPDTRSEEHTSELQ